MISKQQGFGFFRIKLAAPPVGRYQILLRIFTSVILSSFINLRNSVADNDQNYLHIPGMLGIIAVKPTVVKISVGTRYFMILVTSL